MNALLARVLMEVARRRLEDLPGLTEVLQDQVLVTSGGTSSQAYGWLEAEAWQHGGRPVHELFVNACFSDCAPSISPAENVLVTLLHEAVHAYAATSGIKDTSRQGRYHNRRFAELALVIGLHVERDARVGHHTPRLANRGRADYGDLVAELGHGLVLERTPHLDRREQTNSQVNDSVSSAQVDAARPAAPGKYVFASCQCQSGRTRVTIRVARGGWRPGVTWCRACDRPFVPSL
ncbi:hypothetical protein AB5J62_29930 [Amycolatopsis sp. cg5]|uniref:hypothetical protein n=1 Tax=Amycolatopsis sp. cg5 TaxID=3238802 RepID=UPI003525190A